MSVSYTYPDARFASASRRVARLRLSVSRLEDVSRGSFLIEDALRTASFPGGEGGRVLLIRRLVLGRIKREASPMAVARQLERAVLISASDAVAADAPEADSAAAVVMASRTTGLVMLASALARGQTTRAWFWPKLVPGWDVAGSKALKWRRLFDAAHALPEGAAAAAAVVSEAVNNGVARELLDAVDSDLARHYLLASGWTTDRSGSPLKALPAFPEAAIRDLLGAGQPVDDRMTWLAVLLAIHHQPSRAADRHLPSRVSKWLHQLSESVHPYRMADGDPAAAEVGILTFEADAGDGADVHHAEAADTRGWEKATNVVPADEELPGSSIELPRTGSRFGIDEDDIGYTRYGGLLFLIHVLRRLDMDDWIAGRPDLLDAGFPAQLLRAAGMVAGMGREDSMYGSLEQEGAGDQPLHIGYPPLVREIISGLLDRVPASDMGCWLLALRRWCRLNARMNMRAVVQRPGRLVTTRTHLNVHFEVSGVDVRIRRTMLDLDPGWVPWLGRVVLFHYGSHI
jgi:hypothetical protein